MHRGFPAQRLILVNLSRALALFRVYRRIHTVVYYVHAGNALRNRRVRKISLLCSLIFLRILALIDEIFHMLFCNNFIFFDAGWWMDLWSWKDIMVNNTFEWSLLRKCIASATLSAFLSIFIHDTYTFYQVLHFSLKIWKIIDKSRTCVIRVSAVLAKFSIT